MIRNKTTRTFEAMRTKARQIGVLPIVPMVAEWSVPKLPLVITLGNLRDYGTLYLFVACFMFMKFIMKECFTDHVLHFFFFSHVCVHIYIYVLCE